MNKLRLLGAEAVLAVMIWVGFLLGYHAFWGVVFSNSVNLVIDIASTLVMMGSLIVMWASGRRSYTEVQKRTRIWLSMSIVLFGLLVLTAGLHAASQARADPCLDPRIAPGAVRPQARVHCLSRRWPLPFALSGWR